MVNLDVQLWELGIQRLHQGLSETILVNTLTDVRELKKKTNYPGAGEMHDQFVFRSVFFSFKLL